MMMSQREVHGRTCVKAQRPSFQKHRKEACAARVQRKWEGLCSKAGERERPIRSRKALRAKLRCSDFILSATKSL